MMSLERSDSLHNSKDGYLFIDCLFRQFSADPIETSNFVSLVPPSDLSLGVLDSMDGALRVEGDSGVNYGSSSGESVESSAVVGVAVGEGDGVLGIGAVAIFAGVVDSEFRRGFVVLVVNVGGVVLCAETEGEAGGDN